MSTQVNMSERALALAARFGLVILLCTGMTSLWAQRDLSYILANMNIEALHRFSAELNEEYEREHAKALAKAREKGWRTENLWRLDHREEPIYVVPTNDAAATMTETVLLRNNFGVYGQGMTIGMWESTGPGESDGLYAPLTDHQDLTGRIFHQDGGASTNASFHATHVAGTLIGSPPTGVSTASRGMAPQATLKAWSSANDVAEMAAASGGALGLLVSNHSYGDYTGWNLDLISINGCLEPIKKWTWHGGTAQFTGTGEDEKAGQYNFCRELDSLCRMKPHYLPVYGAGNWNNGTPEEHTCLDDQVRNGTSGAYVSYQPGEGASNHPAGNSTKRSTMGTRANAKNILTVGNLQANYDLNSSSSRGVTDDGRIKPDICGKGTDVYSASNASFDSYATATGTSTATPNVAGSLLLLQELYDKRRGNNGAIFMRSASLKGLAIHTATDLGNSGPDVAFGWGLLDANRAGTVINEDVWYTGTQASQILEINEPDWFYEPVWSYFINANSSTPIKVTLCYTDKESTNTTVHNDPTKKLVNDLDLRVERISPSPQTYYPYVLQANATLPAVTGDNDVDNVEQVYIPTPVAGVYRIIVTTEGTITGTQPYSVIISGQRTDCYNSFAHGDMNVPANTYNASNMATSIGNVISGTTVNYRAGTSITLSPGFNADSGSSFNAKIQSCN